MKHARVRREGEFLEPRNCLSTVAFATRELAGLDRSVRAAEVGDFNGDEVPDIMVAYSDPYGVVWFAKDEINGRFAAHRVGEAADLLDAIAVDVDGDSDLDVVTLSRRQAILSWFENNGQGDFVVVNDGRGNFGNIILDDLHDELGIAMTVADLDGDGDPDVVAAYGNAANQLAWFENLDGRGTFGPGQGLAVLTGIHYTAVVSDDLNNDGDIDIVVANSESISVFENSGAAIFEPRFLYKTDGEGRSFPQLAIGDLDNDGHKDVVAAISWENWRLAWFRNSDGMGNFGEPQTIVDDDSRFFTLALSDIDGDRDIDVVASEYQGSRIPSEHNPDKEVITWFENSDGKGAFASRRVVAQRAKSSAFAVEDFDGDGDADVFAAAARLDSIVYFEQRVVGDVNDDHIFNSEDLVEVFQLGKYENAVVRDAIFEEGDWNGYGDFDSADLVFAFQAGSYSRLASSSRDCNGGARRSCRDG